jgi:hypothetical protein
MLPAKPVDLVGDSKHAKPVGIVQRRGEAQIANCQEPSILLYRSTEPLLTRLCRPSESVIRLQ